ncbi:MAG: endonuclease/exonuclease/phosphatase family protein, partial [Clostridia bacterium]|nr:endonuclease/exonuclease/phosphatase family protein [Clostridia bacterium]
GGTPLVDSCYNVGQVVAASGHAHSLMGSAGNAGKVYNSIGAGTISAESGSMIYSKADIFADTARMPLYNTYAVGLPVALYDGDPSEYEANPLTINGHLYTAAALEENYRNDDLLEVAAKINSNLADSGKGFDPVYYTLDAQGNLKFGSATDRAVTVQVKLPQLKNPLTYYAVTGDAIVVDEAEGMVCVTEGVQVEGNVITAGAQDVLVTFAYSESQLFEAAKERLQTMIGYYQQRDPALFADWSVQQNWLEQAQAALTKEDLSLAEIEAILEAETLLDKSAAEGTDAADPSISKYLIYQNTGVKDFTIGSKADWLFAVAQSDAVALEEDAADFTGVTLHLIADIDMNHENMLPLCNGGVFNGNLDGHYYAFKNINIAMENPRGAVGLIGEQGENRWIRNLGVESGMVAVTGATIGKDGMPTENVAGGILGIAQGGADGYIRNCWNGAEVHAENTKLVGGIIGKAIALQIMDGCYNLGKTDRAGLIGLATLETKIYNSFNAGNAARSEASAWGVIFPLEILTTDKTEAFPFVNTYGVGWIFDFVGGDIQIGLPGSATLQDHLNRNEIILRYKVDSAKKAAYQINQNYVDTGLGERVWFTTDENGYVRFGTEAEQVRKVVLQSPGYDDEEVYAAAGKTVNLRFELDSNYFALVGDYESTTLEGNQLTLGNEDSVVRVGVAAYMGDANGNGKIELHDAITILRHIVDDAVDCDIVAGDVNYNAEMDANDAVLVVRGWLNDPECTFKPQKPEISEDWIKVVSYNVKALSYIHGSTAEGDSFEAVADVLKAVDADIIGLQEMDLYAPETGYKNQAKELAKALEAATGCTYYYHTATTGAKNNTYGHAIISKYPILSSEVIYFKDAPGEIDGDEPRAYSRHVLDVNGKEVIYYNSHLAQRGIQQLAYMMESSMEAEYDAGKYVLMTADFNMYPWDYISSYDAEKFTVLNGGEDTSCFVETTTNTQQPIDNILISDNIEYYWDEARDCGIKVVDSTASDHSLIYSYIRLK